MKKNILGITGGLGSGKSFIAEELKTIWPNPLHIIDIDLIRRFILWSSIKTEHIQLRKQLGVLFNIPTQGVEHWLNRDEFTQHLFQSQDTLSQYSLLATPVFHHHIEHVIQEHDDCIISWAYLIEENYYSFLNTPLILVYCDKSIIEKRLQHTITDLQPRFILEPSYQQRIHYLQSHHIDFVSYDNSHEHTNHICSLSQHILNGTPYA